MNKDFYSDRISNMYWFDCWICFVCYYELGNVGEGMYICFKCYVRVECGLDYVLECVVFLVQDEEIV